MASPNDLPQTPENPPADTGGVQVPPPTEPPAPPQQEPDKDARMWATLAHLAGLAALLPVVPLLGMILGPLIVWLIKKDQYPFVDDQGKEALNFQITMFISMAIGFVLTVLVVTACIGLPLMIATAITDIVLLIIAAIKANDGYRYRYPYPLIIRFIK